MIKISSKMDAEAWRALRAHARESGRSIASVLTEAVQEYVARRRVRPIVLEHLRRSLRDNAGLGQAGRSSMAPPDRG